MLSYNDSAPKTTIRELNALVTTISGKSNFVGIQMLLNKSRVDVLVEKMKKHEEEVVTVLLSIAASVPILQLSTSRKQLLMRTSVLLL